MPAVGCTLGESLPLRATGQMPGTTSLTGLPHCSAPQPSGCRQVCASASAGLGMPCRGGSCCQEQQSHIHPWGQRSNKGKLQHHTPLGAGGQLIQPSIRPRGRWMRPQFWGLRRFNARPCQMVQDQRRFNLLPSSQLPHPSLSPAPMGSWVLSNSCPTKVERRETASPRKTRPVTAVAVGRGSSAPHSCNTTPTSTSSTSTSSTSASPQDLERYVASREPVVLSSGGIPGFPWPFHCILQ